MYFRCKRGIGRDVTLRKSGGEKPLFKLGFVKPDFRKKFAQLSYLGGGRELPSNRKGRAKRIFIKTTKGENQLRRGRGLGSKLP